MGTHEHTINNMIACILDSMRGDLKVRGEPTQAIEGGHKRPDILAIQAKSVIIIENEYAPADNVEQEAVARLSKKVAGRTVSAVIALVTPKKFKDSNNPNQDDLRVAEFQYAMFSGDAENPARFPVSGWIQGRLADLASLVGHAAIPPHLIKQNAQILQEGVEGASFIMKDAVEHREDVYRDLGELLKQYPKGENQLEQLRRMCMAIIINALVFHYNLAGMHDIKDPGRISASNGKADHAAFIKEWEEILKINYWPIFFIAKRILEIIPLEVSTEFFTNLQLTAQKLIIGGVTRSHDLSGRVFQRLIADRKFLATFYTRPASAVLLANMAVPSKAPFDSGSWQNLFSEKGKKLVNKYTVGDFACGTGTLLSSAYQRISELHERDGGRMHTKHKHMMERGLVGCDVMPAAVHLTTSMLSGIYPTESYNNTRIHTLVYGKGEKEYQTGALDLLASQNPLSVFSPVKTQSAKGEKTSDMGAIPWHSFDLVIMNPPFSSSTNHEGAHKDIPNPAWAAFGMDAKTQRELGNRAIQLRQGTCGHGNAGLASDFMGLADKMVNKGGTVAAVLPLTVMAGESWTGVRSLWGNCYDNIRVVSISHPDSNQYSFSADTGMGEALLIGEKLPDNFKKKESRGLFVVLKAPPADEIQANVIAHAIAQKNRGKVNKIEEGPIGGTVISVGESEIGYMLDSPLPQLGGSWGVSRIRDLCLAQTAWALSHSNLWLPRQNKPIKLPMACLGKFSERGPLARDINGMNGRVPRGPFDILDLSGEKHPTYPCLWAHDNKRETSMVVLPDSKGVVRTKMAEKAQKVWGTASRVHHSMGFRFNSQALAAAYTEELSIGGSAWPNIIFKKKGHEMVYMLWANSTLGLLMYWWESNKIHSGRGMLSLSRVPDMPVLDLGKLTAVQLRAAQRGFNTIKSQNMLPAYLSDICDVRKEIDRILVEDVLKLPKSKEILSGLDVLRKKFCAEPSVAGTKKR